MPPEYWAMAETGEGTSLHWRGPFLTSQEAENTAMVLLLSGRIPDSQDLNKFRNVYRYAWFGTRTKATARGRFNLDGTYLYDRELGNKRGIVSDATLAGIQANSGELLEDVCFGPLEEDFCDPCKDVIDYLNNPVNAQLSARPIQGFAIAYPAVAPAVIASLAEVLPAEVAAFPEGFGDFYNWPGFRGLYGGFWTLPPIAGFPEEDNGTDSGGVYYLPSGSTWGVEGMLCKFLWVPPDGIPLWPLNGIFPDETITEQTPRTFLLKYRWNSELFAYSFQGGNPSTPGESWSARGSASEDSIGMNRIYAGVQSGELPAEAITFERSFWETATVHFKKLTDFTPETTAYKGWVMAVRFSITPVYRVTDNDMLCLQEIDGEETHFSIINRSDRVGYSGGTMFENPFPADVNDPEFIAGNHDYNKVLELPGNMYAPWDNGRFIDDSIVTPPADIPLGPPVQRRFLGYSGNGIPLSLLVILNPNWFVQGFLENYKPFQGIPGYKYVVQFLRYITGEHAQFDVIGTDPVTGFDLYPVPVIVGANEQGFAVYGPAVYTHDTQSYYP